VAVGVRCRGSAANWPEGEERRGERCSYMRPASAMAFSRIQRCLEGWVRFGVWILGEGGGRAYCSGSRPGSLISSRRKLVGPLWVVVSAWLGWLVWRGKDLRSAMLVVSPLRLLCHSTRVCCEASRSSLCGASSCLANLLKNWEVLAFVTVGGGFTRQ